LLLLFSYTTLLRALQLIRPCSHGGMRVFPSHNLTAQLDGRAALAVRRKQHPGATGNGAVLARYSDGHHPQPRHVAGPHAHRAGKRAAGSPEPADASV